jgi:sirohydrochlorin ferrochelatase
MRQRPAGLLLVAHGERGPGASNRSLAAHAARIAALWPARWVGAAVLHGVPPLEEALEEAGRRVEHILVYPVFMSSGRMVTRVLPQRLAGAAMPARITSMAPLGTDRRLAPLLLQESLNAARAAGLAPRQTRLLVVGHGSRSAREPAASVLRVVDDLSGGVFASVEPAFIEETPLLGDALRSRADPTVIAGFLSGEGIHACRDVLAAMKEAGAPAAYTGPIGAHPRVSALIMSAAAETLSRLRARSRAGCGDAPAAHACER